MARLFSTLLRTTYIATHQNQDLIQGDITEQHIVIHRPRRLITDLVHESLAPKHGHRRHRHDPVEGDALARLDLFACFGDDLGRKKVEGAELVGGAEAAPRVACGVGFQFVFVWERS